MDNRASTDLQRYPNLIPEDCHIRSSSDMSNGEIDFNNAPPFGWTTLNFDVLGLVDIAQEDRNNTRTGAFELPPYASFNQWEKPTFIRQPLHPQYYPNGEPVAEDIREYLKRWTWWLTERIGFSGYRLDAVRHVPPGFFARISRQPGGQVSIGDLVPFLYSLNPNLYLFGEDYSDNSYELREYAKTGMNLLDFPMKFMMDDLFNSSGYGSLGLSLTNGYGIDSGTGLTFELGGLASHIGVGFVQSHDLAPPWSNNLAYAWLLTRPGRPIVYYDGNNVNPNDWNHFPKPGRYDALGAGGDTLLRVLDARYRYARGTLVNRYVSAHLYIYERQVNGKGVLLVGLNNRGDRVELRATVQTAFEPGTLLVDLINQKPPVVVDRNGRVTITVPYNSEDGNPNNGRGYVLYAEPSPLPRYGTPPVQLYDARYAGFGSPG
ncbi:MAG: hypothetical protein NZ934_04805, partial [Hadesarchaea archaeon]|nr:hypothetical protein [Hadesarchaea archaeon]